MLTKHFLKTLIVFMVLIIVGLISVFAVGFFSNSDSVAGGATGASADVSH
jgi:hypothetical protein